MVKCGLLIKKSRIINPFSYFPGQILLPIFIAAALMVHITCYADEWSPPLQGELQVTSDMLQPGSTVELNGDYEFYWERFVEPGDFGVGNKPDALQAIPGSWKGLELEESSPGRYGYATYRLLVALPAGLRSGQVLGIEFGEVSHSYRLYLDGRLWYTCGTPGKDRQSTEYGVKSTIKTLPPGDSDTLEVLIHTSNFDYFRSGLNSAPRIGRVEDLEGDRSFGLVIDIFLFGAIFAIGLYHLILFMLRNREWSLLFFGLSCIIISARSIFNDNLTITAITDAFPAGLMLRIQFLSFYLGVAFYGIFTWLLFSNVFNKKVVIGFSVVYGVYSLVTGVLPAHLYTHLLPHVQVLTIFYIAYCFFIISRQVIRRDLDAVIFLLGFLFLASSTIIDIIGLNLYASFKNITPIGLFLFILVQTTLLARRYAGAFQTVEYLTENLDNIVEERTLDLNQALENLTVSNIELNEMSILDPLTRAFNRRYFMETLDVFWRKAIREKESLCLLMLDVDYFKSVNDTWGHRVGDECLKHIVSVVKQELTRPEDFVARYGGEELVICQLHSTGIHAMDTAEKVRQAIEARPLVYDRNEINVTVSIGISCFTPTIDDDPDTIIKQADAALYRAKQAGRNRVVTHGR
jgi:diguanylate cyclase (GGDEF)-like protein